MELHAARVLLWILALQSVGPPPVDAVASWVLSGALTLTLGALAFFLVRTYKRIEHLEEAGLQGRADIMEKVEEGHTALAGQIERILNKLENHAVSIASINKEIELRVESGRQERERNMLEHKEFFDQLRGMAKELAERRLGRKIE